MHEIDLSKYDLRTDLIIENNLNNVINKKYEKNNIMVNDITLNKINDLKKKEGKYITISYKDITDSINYKNVLDIFKKELLKVIKYLKIKNSDTCLVVGLGNRKIISDALGSKCLEKIIVTRHLYLLNDVDKKYRNVSILEPNVLGVTGIESFEIIENVVKRIKPDFIIAIDSLCAINIERLNKTIQISSSGITPGSGIGNERKELSKDTLGVPIVAIGVPTVVSSTSIVADTIFYIQKKIGYLKNNMNKNIDKLKNPETINYLNSFNDLNISEKKEILGYIGLLDDDKLKSLIKEVLNPINADMIVTTKEIDFIIEKLGCLISEGINDILHNTK